MTQPAQLTEVRPFYGGSWHDAPAAEIVRDKYTDQPVTSVGCSDEGQITDAVESAVRGQQAALWGPVDRFRALSRASELLLAQAEDVIETIVADTGFTLTDATREVERAAQTLLISGEEAKRLVGEVVPLEGAPGVRDRIGYTMFRPVGVVCAITPFNSPVNTLLHKVAPALAAGNSIVIKPAMQTPRTADRVLRLLLEAGVPSELLSVVYGHGPAVGRWLLDDPRPAFYAFTGSTEVGRLVQRGAGLRRTQLEMGSLSSTLVCADAAIEPTAAKIVAAAFRKAGQVCTSVQRLYVERAAVPDLAATLIRIVGTWKAGNPTLPETNVGPVISPGEADRISKWIGEAVDGGASVATGGSRDGNVVLPTILTDVNRTMLVMSREIFGPVVVVRPFDDLDVAIAEINDTPYGLAAGIFTRDINRALYAANRLHMGSVHINETSSSRVDLMPYTGAKLSGVGREGPRYAMREMSEERLVTIGPG